MIRPAQGLACLLAIGLWPLTSAAQDQGDVGPGGAVHFGPLELTARGFYRAPLRLAWRCRMTDSAGNCAEPTMAGNGMSSDSKYNLHTPWLIDDDYFRSGFAYTRLQEQDYAEIYLGIGNEHLKGEVAFMNSLFSDWARPLLENQLGIAQAYLRFNWDWGRTGKRFRLTAKAGAFWDRFGWMQAYDTYLFGRTHQLGGQLRGDLTLGTLELSALYGFGAHLEAIDVNQGLTLLNYVHLRAAWNRTVALGFYFLDSRSRDQRQLSMIRDAQMQVTGLDVTVTARLVGRLWLGASLVAATQASFLSPTLEVLHSYGGRGVAENFLGTDKSDNGTGNLWNLGFEGALGLKEIFHFFNIPDGGTFNEQRDLKLKYFGLCTYTESVQQDPDPTINRDRRTSFKWGLEPTAQIFSWLGASLRYDRVVVDMHDEASSFRVISPRLFFTVRWYLEAQIVAQYSHYSYGARALLRPGQVPLETLPDTDVFKLQAQFVF